MAISVAEGMSAQCHSALTGLGVGGNAITFGVALQLGASNATLGWIAAIPMLATCVQLFSASRLHRFPSRRGPTAVTSAVARALLPLCAVPAIVVMVPLDPLTVLIAGWVVSNALLAFATNAWVSWMADVVPAQARARYFSRRTAACTAAGIAASLLGGWWLDVHGSSSSWGLAGVMGAAMVAGVVCTVLLFAQPEPERPVTTERRHSANLRGTVIEPFLDAVRTPGLGGVIGFVAMFGFANGVAAPFWSPFQLEELGLSYTTVNGVLTLVQGLLTVAALPVWGAVAARHGHRVVVVLCVALTCTHPFYYLAATREHPWWVLLDSASSGIAWSGYNLCIFNLVLSLARGPRMERLYAVYIAIGGMAQALAAVCSGGLIGLFPAELRILDVTLHQRQEMFLVTFVVRAMCLGFFMWRVPEGRPGETRAVLVAIPTAIKARMGEVRFLPRK